jgi:DNA-binding LytR/AlgR family response regulator
MTIRALIVEDERPAADQLAQLLKKSEFDFEILKVTDSVTSTIQWLKSNPSPDLIFLDIQLADGLSFELFQHIRVDSPVIFTTAYEEYAIQAFKVNSVDYLLKPVEEEELEFATEKFLKHYKTNWSYELMRGKVDQLYEYLGNTYKKRFVVNAGPHIRSIDIRNIQCFYSLEKATFLLENTGKSYDIAYSLDQIESRINPGQFFRINRKYIVNIDAIEDIVSYSSSRLWVSIKGSDLDDMVVSRSRIKDFKQWLER